jgi:murein DD-endopeptidase MepM/ murein hydrolase activator NlpD
MPVGSASVLPSGSSEAFRKQMMDWARPTELAPLRLKDPLDQGQVRLDHLKISSRFGWRSDPMTDVERRHEGIDLPGQLGSPVMATAAGIVRIAGWERGYGNLVEIVHPGGVRTRYGHLSRLNVFASEQVEQGQVIGAVGTTGRSTGPHLHYEVRLNGRAVDPLTFIKQSHASYETVWGSERPATPRWAGWHEGAPAVSLPESQLR